MTEWTIKRLVATPIIPFIQTIMKERLNKMTDKTIRKNPLAKKLLESIIYLEKLENPKIIDASILEGLDFQDVVEGYLTELNDFSQLIRERLTDEEFWAWYNGSVIMNPQILGRNRACEVAEKWSAVRRKKETYEINKLVRELAGERQEED